MTREDSYKETKQCRCICCGEMVTVTKFASAAKVMCTNCKKSNAAPSNEILSSIDKKSDRPNKSTSETKELPCIQCGSIVIVTKFASAAKVMCNECKGESLDGLQRVNIDISKLDRNVIPPIEEYIATPMLVANSNLRNVGCPACNHKYMKMLKVLDWSDRGLIIHYQCTECFLLVSISEQAKQMVSYKNDGQLFDYGGNAIEDMMSYIKSSRANAIIQQLMGLLKQNNIEIEAMKLPPYVNDNNRPVPVGYRIPRDDPSIKAIDDTIKYLSSLCDDNRANELLVELQKLFKDGQND